MIQLTPELFTQIDHFIGQSIHDFRMLNISNRELKILMPEELILCIKRYNERLMFGYVFENHYRSVEIGQHYKNEIVVFFPYFFYRPDLYAPKIFEIPK